MNANLYHCQNTTKQTNPSQIRRLTTWHTSVEHEKSCCSSPHSRNSACQVSCLLSPNMMVLQPFAAWCWKWSTCGQRKWRPILLCWVPDWQNKHLITHVLAVTKCTQLYLISSSRDLMNCLTIYFTSCPDHVRNSLLCPELVGHHATKHLGPAHQDGCRKKLHWRPFSGYHPTKQW